jgi:hypothetical protein
MMMIRTLLMTLVSIVVAYATEQHGGNLLRGAGGNIPELLGAEQLVDVDAVCVGCKKPRQSSCTYEFKFGTDNCPMSYYCDIGKGTCLDTGVAKVRGVCKLMSRSCPANEYNMVCGCDGSTWTSPCEAAKFGENIAYNGVCRG